MNHLFTLTWHGHRQPCASVDPKVVERYLVDCMATEDQKRACTVWYMNEPYTVNDFLSKFVK